MFLLLPFTPKFSEIRGRPFDLTQNRPYTNPNVTYPKVTLKVVFRCY